MYFDSEETAVKNTQSIKTVYIYENSCNDKEPIEYKIRNQCNFFRDVSRILKFKKLRLFNQEGAQYFQDDLRFVKNKTSLYASRGEEFDPHNCFGQYEIGKKLGQGGFGQVFLAHHKHTGEKCAIKKIKITSSSDIDSIFVQAQILKSLKHENIVKVTNCLTLKNMEVAIIMEYLQGGQLLQLVQKQGKLSQQTCKIFLKQIVKGIMYCHENNLVHRDLKLQNILLVNSEQNKIKIIDFGIAGVMSRLTEQDLDAGSLGYMAPECFQSFPNNGSNQPNFKFDGRMDVWAIGVILFSMLNAQLPFKGSNHAQIKQNIKKAQYKIPLQIKKSISKQCLSVIFRCLDPNPKTRIKIGQLMNHEWFATSNQKTIMTSIVDQEPQEVAQTSSQIQKKSDDIIQNVAVPRQKPILSNFIQNKSLKKQSKQIQKSNSVSKNKIGTNTNSVKSSLGFSIYKTRQNTKSKGKENTQNKLKL